MTEKRFIILDSSISGRYIKDKEHRFDEPMNLREVCNLLNELNNKNKQLKQQFNYIQNSISEHIKHQKTELGQKALQEIIEDYNEWLLGHKRL